MRWTGDLTLNPSHLQKMMFLKQLFWILPLVLSGCFSLPSSPNLPETSPSSKAVSPNGAGAEGAAQNWGALQVQQSQLQQEVAQLAEQQEQAQGLLAELKELPESMKQTTREQQTQVDQVDESLTTRFALMEEGVRKQLASMQEQLDQMQQQIEVFHQKIQTALERPKPAPPATKVTRKLPAPKEPSVKTIPLVAISSKTDKAEEMSAQPYQDADLDEPQSPKKLKRYPGVKKRYNQGMSELIQGNHQEAIKIFSDFKEQYANDFDSDNAQFWIGHSYLQLGEMDRAEAAFRAVLTQYEHRPTSQGYKTPDAIYMLGKIYAQREQPKKARYYFEAVIQKYPGSAAASNAQEALAGLPATR